MKRCCWKLILLSKAGLDRVRRDAEDKDTDKISLVDRVDEEEEEEDKVDKVEHFSNLLPSGQTIATVLRGIADAADLYGS